MLNKVMIIGNLGADPEMRYPANGSAVTNFNVATNPSYTNSADGGTCPRRAAPAGVAIPSRGSCLVQAARNISVPSGPIPICAAGVNATRERGRTTRRSVPLTTPLVPSSVRPGGRLEAALSA